MSTRFLLVAIPEGPIADAIESSIAEIIRKSGGEYPPKLCLSLTEESKSLCLEYSPEKGEFTRS